MEILKLVREVRKKASFDGEPCILIVWRHEKEIFGFDEWIPELDEGILSLDEEIWETCRDDVEDITAVDVIGEE